MIAKRNDALGVALIGAGSFGRRRAEAVADSARSEIVTVADPVAARAVELADRLDCDATANWRQAAAHGSVEAVVVSTPPNVAPTIARFALSEGKHVLVEKPFGRSARELWPIADVARHNHVLLKAGYNHRYHPGIQTARQMFADGVIGKLLHLTCTYGHGGRPGYEREWRTAAAVAGGGELLDQGVHAIDLFRWFAGDFEEAFAFLSTSCWPIAPAEDNAFALLRSQSGIVAQLHASWTQWKNTFQFEIVGDLGSLSVNGLGRSYGPERLVWTARSSSGAPEQKTFEFLGEDDSLAREWEDFLDAIDESREPMSGAADAARTLEHADALYASAHERRIVRLDEFQQQEAAQAAGARSR
jgi:predicted dehydrogenase